MAFQGNAFQGNAFQVAGLVALVLQPTTESVGPAYRLTNVTAVPFAQNLLTSTLAPTVTYTLRPYVDERNYSKDPWAAIRSQAEQTGFRGHLVSVVQAPLVQRDWPNP